MKMTKQEMMTMVCNQLAIDYNCKPADFNKTGVIFTVAERQEGRREMPFITPRLGSSQWEKVQLLMHRKILCHT